MKSRNVSLLYLLYFFFPLMHTKRHVFTLNLFHFICNLAPPLVIIANEVPKTCKSDNIWLVSAFYTLVILLSFSKLKWLQIWTLRMKNHGMANCTLSQNDLELKAESWQIEHDTKRIANIQSNRNFLAINLSETTLFELVLKFELYRH